MKIPKGVDSGLNLRMAKKGNAALQGDFGDLLIKVKVSNHPYFKREGYDIITEKKITVTQAILGKTIKVETIEGPLDLKVNPGEERIVLKGMGINKLPPNQNEKGDQIVLIKVTFPKNLSEKQRQALEAYALVEDQEE